jgi:hypothetical protein
MYICGEKKEKFSSVVIVENEIVHTYHDFFILTMTLRGVDIRSTLSISIFSPRMTTILSAIAQTSMQ